MLDVVRGFAVLGIFVMNIQSFSMISAAYANPLATNELARGLDGGNYAVWLAGQVFFNAKFMSLFSILFGAGILLMSQRCEATDRNPASTHYRRLAGLLLIGLLHGYGFWYGDILVPYAICAAVVYPAWRWRNRVRLALAACLFLMGSLVVVLMGLSMPFWPQADRVSIEQEMWRPTAEMVAAEIAAYTGPWWPQLVDRAAMTIQVQTFGMAFLLFWQISALMLIGMTLLQTGVLTGRSSKRVYICLSLLGFGVGLPLIYWGVLQHEQHEWSMEYSMLIGTQPNYFGSLLMALGYIGVWGVLLHRRVGQAAGWLLAPVGRMALTNYLMQTLIGTTIFYGHGFGQFTNVSRIGQACIVIITWLCQIAFSHWWLNRFRYGPAEYVWRRVTYANFSAVLRSHELDKVTT